MAEKNIQIKIDDGGGLWDDLYPKTKIELVDGLGTELSNKVDKVSGKGLSTEDFTSSEKSKLSGIQANANNYVHPSSHSPSIILQDSNNRFVTDAEKSTWNSKQDSLGFTPEDSNNKGVAGGYASLDANSKIPLSQLPDVSKGQTYIVEDATERNALTGMLPADKAFETSTGDSYIYDGSSWRIHAKADWENVNLDWNNISNAPSSSPSQIDSAVSDSHTHSNKSTLDKISDSAGASSYDLAQFLTPEDIEELGGGDMLKSEYDSNNDGKVDAADAADSVPWAGVTGRPTSSASAIDSAVSDSHAHSNKTVLDGITNTQITNWNSKSKIHIGTTEPTDDSGIWFQEV